MGIDEPHCWRLRDYGRAPCVQLLQLLMAFAAPSHVTVSAAAARSLDLTPLDPWSRLPAAQLLQQGATLVLAFDWPRTDDDPRELSEIPELRLWSLRADAACPWLPLLLERSQGQLARHVAMLLPHSFSRSEGLRFAPEALDLWITHRLFVLDDWARGQGLNCRQNLAQMAAVLGYELDAGFWSLVQAPPPEGPG